MTDSEIVAFLIGTVAPLLIAVIERRAWPDEVRHIIALVSYLIISLFIWFFQHSVSFDGLGWRDVVRTFAPVMIGGAMSFQLVWKRTLAPKIEKATS